MGGCGPDRGGRDASARPAARRAPAPAPQRPAAPDPAPDAPPAPSWLSPLSGRKGGPGVNGSAPRNGNVDWLSRPKR
ncbi:hypothetical protein GAY29_27700 [Azospirillum brasilense]|nr:hypothetical protein [Azospirillum brasilense]